ncbi:hypothetical protein SFB21_1920 [Acinetobacter bouvetii]|uniref:Uncharacterized protein n=2 Tax=Acinetobacter bouvetii TaxID=202951 RepID=A0A811GFK8_9GAMM|nr:hypothetical protein SFB21_1920 [Acinetobacter bouvetii]
MNFSKVFIIAGWVTLSITTTLAADQMTKGAKASSEQASSTANTKDIASAMSAAPKKVGAAATIVVVEGDGKMRTLRKGHNGFTCMPDNPTTPGPDPMCMDKAALEWAEAWMGHKTPMAGKIGLMYMLEGGTDASNVDPYAKKPTTGNHWIKTGPHVMIVGAEQSFYDMYPKTAQPDTGAPYVMWSGTPYQHLMIPVK